MQSPIDSVDKIVCEVEQAWMGEIAADEKADRGGKKQLLFGIACCLLIGKWLVLSGRWM